MKRDKTLLCQSKELVVWLCCGALIANGRTSMLEQIWQILKYPWLKRRVKMLELDVTKGMVLKPLT